MNKDVGKIKSRPETKQLPNMVVIMSDQHNPHFMGCAGHEFVSTPNIDSLAKEGVRFTNAYTPSPLCVPARMGFMTGDYPSKAGVFDNGSILSSHIPTFAHSLGGAGYETILCGRMHFAGFDRFHGFEKRIAGECGNVLSPEIQGSGNNRTNGQTAYAVKVSGHGRTGFQVYDRHVVDKACEFIRSRGRNERPYCLVIGLMLPHNPLICPKELFDYYMARLPLPRRVSKKYLDSLHPAVRKWRERRRVDDISSEQSRRGLAAYCGLITELDTNIGRILSAVQSSSSRNDTLTVYTSDHGDMANEHGMWWKSNFYEGSVGVPLIVFRPGHIFPGISDELVSLVDIGPTLIEFAGAETLPGVDGKSFVSVLSGAGNTKDKRMVFSECPAILGDLPSFMVRKGPWKLNFYHEFDSAQLFNLQKDPGETEDLRSDPAHGEILEHLKDIVRSKWSGEYVLSRQNKQREAMDIIFSCGHDYFPHSISEFNVPKDCNEFDFNQLEKNTVF